MVWHRRGLIGGTESNTLTGLVSNSDYLSLLNNQKSLKNFSLSPTTRLTGKTYIDGFCVSDDGRHAYLINTSGDYISQYALSTPYDVSSASLVRNVLVTSTEGTGQAVNISPDGKYLYLCGYDRDNPIMYTMTTPYDLSTITYGYNIKVLENIFSLGTADSSLRNFEFGDDGYKLYLLGFGDDNVQQFSLSSPYDIETQSYDGQYYLTGLTVPHGIYWKSDGTQFFILNNGDDKVYSYSCSTAWDVTTGVTATQSSATLTEDTSPTGITFKPDGTKMYIVGDSGNEINEYSLSTAWDLSTLSFVRVKTNVSNGSPGNISFSPDGTKMFLTSIGTSGRVDQFSLSTAWDISTAGNPIYAYDPNESVITTSSNRKGYISSLGCAVFGDDGKSITLMDVWSSDYDRLLTYPLRVAYDISTILNGILGSSRSGSTSPSSIIFNRDGTKCFVSDISTEYVYQYSLYIPWIIGEGNRSYDGILNLSAVHSSLHGICFDRSGYTMFTMDRASDTLRQYRLNTAYDVTDGATLVSSNVLTSLADVTPTQVHISTPGHKLYLSGQSSNTFVQFDLSF